MARGRCYNVRVEEMTYREQFLTGLSCCGIQIGDDWFASLQAAGGAAGLRRLSAREIARLEAQGNSAPDWSGILVAAGFSPEFITGNLFADGCVLGLFDGTPAALENGATIPTGVFHSTIQRSIIESGAAIHRCPLIQGYHVGSGAAISGTTLLYDTSGTCGNGRSISVGIETGGRAVVISPEMTLEDARAQAESGPDGAVKPRDSAGIMHLGVVASGARIMATTMIRNSFIGSSVTVSGAQLVEDSTLLATPDEQTLVSSGSIIRSSILQPGVAARDGAIVDRSLLMEHSHADRHAKVSESIIGPNSGISEGEVTASFVGPFVGFHHQALLIAAYWPEGKGNVGYGANVGSNHTSRLPDQEIHPAEGMFFGLGCNIKYPANFTGSPYSIVATGLSTLPQRVSMPFSLLCEPTHRNPDLPSGYCRIIPAWVLAENLYMIWRNRTKYRERNRGRRNAIQWEIFRPEVVGSMAAALEVLRNAGSRKPYYLPEDIPEIGKSVLSEDDRLRAIETYDFFITFAGLKGRVDGGSVLEPEAVRQYRNAVVKIAESVRTSREKDDVRGRRIIDDYATTHPPASLDPVVREVEEWAQAEVLRAGGPETRSE